MKVSSQRQFHCPNIADSQTRSNSKEIAACTNLPQRLPDSVLVHVIQDELGIVKAETNTDIPVRTGFSTNHVTHWYSKAFSFDYLIV